ncbi:ABC transporter ATP-binding protein [Sporolactobacillus shoreicorticis]|uniref:ABC transporter ATP-binding protein n=1 Tax=Sporolactobacillus shoreicorticis TaxID=1923877 RepID=A0ABW5S4X9_9BACL|nr:ABC transporter ATP-binding protein [Sporolactobacillus shoreicorticis]MCO7124294.1 ABC transporter ATP-binding protein [Sporolactobacillus shoreicorticis]
MKSNNDAIKLEGISKSFGTANQPSVKKTNLKIESGSFVTILGASGCGKTTLLKMVNRLYEPSTGKIYINGEDVTTISPTALRRKIGYVIQQTGLFQHMTIEQNVATVPKILGWEKKKIDERIDALLRLVGLSPTDYRKRYPRQLSGGQQQRVGIARAMAADPSIMLMDEPFGAIDAINRNELQDEFLRIQKKLHKTILFVTHDIIEALKLGDKVIIMNAGEIQQFDTPLNILKKPANDFVRNLVHADDLLQRMIFVKARDVMNHNVDSIPVNADAVSINELASIKEVLLKLLESSFDYVKITNEKNELVGQVTLHEIRQV